MTFSELALEGPAHGTNGSRDADRLAFLAPFHPHIGGAAMFNTALLTAMRDVGPVEALNWYRLYPPIVQRRFIKGRQLLDDVSRSNRVEPTMTMLDWPDPRSWRRALDRVSEVKARAMVLGWLHPVMGPPYLYLLSRAPRDVARVMIVHNVVPHDRIPFDKALTRAVLSRAEILITHAPQQRQELEQLGLDGRIVDAVIPRFPAESFAPPARADEARAERQRQGDPDILLLAFGAIRPYKGIDIALEALTHLDPDLRVRLVVAGVAWDGGAPLMDMIKRFGVADRVEVRNRFISHEEAALLFCAADTSLLPYRSATQSAVVPLSFSYGTPVIATRVGGLPQAIDHERDGLLCPPEDPAAIARAIERMAREKAEFAAGVQANDWRYSPERYVRQIHEALAGVASRA